MNIRRCVVLVLALLFFASPQPVSADGTFVWTTRDQDIREPQQKAIIVFDEGREDLILEVKYEGAPGEFGWIVPLPSDPKILPAAADRFEYLSKSTQKAYLARSERSKRFITYRTATRGTEAVSVVRRDTVGIYETTVLAADQGSALTSWLDAHGYRMPSEAPAVLDEYARKKWVFVAMKIVATAQDSSTARKLADGTTQPLRFQFDTDRPIFPLKISSIMGQPSEVLIYTVANKQLASETAKGISWDVQLCGNAVHGLSLYAESRFPNLDWQQAYVTKLRATFKPSQMEDLIFGPYDPLPDLHSSNDAVRAAAVSYVGRLKLADAVPQIIRMLTHAKPSGPDAISGLWALGELGGPDAEACLMKWARSASPECRIEAIESLSRLHSPDLSSALLDILDEWRVAGKEDPWRVKQERIAMGMPEKDPWVSEERQAAVDNLIALGNETCLSRLRKSSTPLADREGWETEISPNKELGLVAALAVCGDAESKRFIQAEILSQGASTSPQALRQAAPGGSTYNSFPAGFWTALAIMPHGHYYKWHALRIARDLLASRPDFLDAMLRECACDPNLPDGGKIVILSSLVNPTTEDLDALDALWSRAIGRDSVTADIGDVHYNLNAVCVAYAFARLGAVDRLLHLWKVYPRKDETLRAEIAYAAASTDSLRLLPIVADYVEKDWSRTAGTPEFRQRLDRWNEVLKMKRRSMWRTEALDLEYRIHRINYYMNVVARDQEERRRLMVDRSIHPIVRLYWISDIPCCFPGEVDLRAVGKGGLEAMEKEHISDPYVLAILQDTGEFHDAISKSRDERARSGELLE